MQIIPAIDLKDNKCVRLTKGEDETSIIFNDNPSEQAKYFQEIGCKKLHIVDLDAAFGRYEVNYSSVKKIRKAINIPIQLGGGIRNQLQAEKYFDIGVENIIIGSMSVTNPDSVIVLSEKYKNRIYVSLDIKNNNVMIKGWKEVAKLTLQDVLNIYDSVDIRGYVITDILNDGMLRGLDLIFIKKIVSQIQENKKVKKNIIIAGGLTNYKDLANIKKSNLNNLEGIISGKSYYSGNIDLIKAQKMLEVNAES